MNPKVMKFSIICFVPFMVAVLALSACGIGSGPASPFTATPKSDPNATSQPPAPAKAAWIEKWDKMVKAAKDEGSVRIYTSQSPDIRTQLSNAFKQKYGIDVEFVTARTPEIAQKVVSERRAGLYLADGFIGGSSLQVLMLKPSGLLEPIEPALIDPEVANPKLWRDNQIPFFDGDHTSIGFSAAYKRYIYINTEVVKPGDISSYRDLLKPQWKGKIALDDPNMGGSGTYWVTVLSYLWGQEGAKSYLRDFQKQDVAVVRDIRQLAEWVARGKYPVAVALRTEVVQNFKIAGAPVTSVEKNEGGLISAGGGGIGLASKAAHPNAALLFVNWLLSKEGQAVFAKAGAVPSARTDVSTEGLDPDLFPPAGEKPFREDEKWIAESAKAADIFNEVFGATGK